MASVALSDLISTYKMSSTFRRQVFEAAAALFEEKQLKTTFAKWPEFRELVTEAAAHEKKTRGLEKGWQITQKKQVATGNPEAVALDRRLDAVVNGLPAKFEAFIGDLEEGDPLLEQADQFLLDLLPLGAAAVTQLDYESERDQFETLLEQLSDPKNAALTKKLGLGVKIAQLKKLLPAFTKALAKAPRHGDVSFDELRAARAEGHDNIARYMVVVCAKFHQRTAADVAMRAKLLAPVLSANAEIARVVARGRGARPETVEPQVLPPTDTEE